MGEKATTVDVKIAPVANPSLSTMQETWVQSLDWEDPLEKRKASHSSILAWRIL